MRFFASAVAVPALAAAAAPLMQFTHRSLLQSWLGVLLADSLGIAILTPAALLVLSAEAWKKKRTVRETGVGIAAISFYVAAEVAIFSQSTHPALFMIFPFLILLVFVLKLEGGVWSLVLATGISCWATSHHSGPLWIVAALPAEQRTLLLQVFLWTIIASTLPIGSLLDEQRAAEQRAATNQMLSKMLLHHAENMIVLVTLDGSSRFVSPAVERVLGWTQEQYIGLTINGRMHPDDRELAGGIIEGLHRGQIEHRMRYRASTSDGGYLWVEAFVNGYRDTDSGPITGYVATVRDISALKEREASWSEERRKLAELAARDELTGIANRRTFNQMLHTEADPEQREDIFSLLMLDVDHFKKFNDRYGHQAGDQCLRKLALVFDQCAERTGDLAARIGGEEFAVLLKRTDRAGAERVAHRAIARVRELRIPHADSATDVVSVSIGVATWTPDSMTDVAQLIEQADLALYESKRNGRDRFTVARRPAAVPF